MDVDDDRIGRQDRRLRRDGLIAAVEAGYDWQLGSFGKIIPALNFARRDIDGDANAADEYGFDIRYQQQLDRWRVEVSGGMDWTRYRGNHPLFDRRRKAVSCDASVLARFEQPFQWSRASLYTLVAYRRVEENIDFFDSETWTLGAGVGYRF